MEVHAEGPNELPKAVRRSSIVTLVISIILCAPTAVAVSNSCILIAILFLGWFSGGDVLQFSSAENPIEGRAGNPLWAMVVGGVLTAGSIILIITNVLGIVISSKGLSKQLSPVENEVLPSLPSCRKCRS
jgi:hypothetical protein